MFNKYKYFKPKKILKKIFFLKKKTKIKSIFLNKYVHIYNGKTYIFRKLNRFQLNKQISNNVFFKKPLTRPFKRKKK